MKPSLLQVPATRVKARICFVKVSGVACLAIAANSTPAIRDAREREGHQEGGGGGGGGA